MAAIMTLRDMAVSGSEQCPELEGRLWKAACIVAFRDIERLSPQTYRVSGEDRARVYIVQNGECTCPDWKRHKDGWFCKHRLAVGMLLRMERQQAEHQQGC